MGISSFSSFDDVRNRKLDGFIFRLVLCKQTNENAIDTNPKIDIEFDWRTSKAAYVKRLNVVMAWELQMQLICNRMHFVSNHAFECLHSYAHQSWLDLCVDRTTSASWRRLNTERKSTKRRKTFRLFKRRTISVFTWFIWHERSRFFSHLFKVLISHWTFLASRRHSFWRFLNNSSVSFVHFCFYDFSLLISCSAWLSRWLQSDYFDCSYYIHNSFSTICTDKWLNAVWWTIEARKLWNSILFLLWSHANLI